MKSWSFWLLQPVQVIAYWDAAVAHLSGFLQVRENCI